MSKFINIIINPVGDSCNLQCKYCYTLKRNEDKKRLPISNIFKLIDFLSNEKDLRCINFTWHGGEPLLMGIDYLQQVLDYQNKKLNNITYYNIIQTNGILLNEQWISLINKYNINLGVSIDGPDYESNSNRFASEQEFELLLRKLDELKKSNCVPALFFTITETNIQKLDQIFEFIEKYQPYAYMFNPVMDSDYVISSEKFEKILFMMKEFSEKTEIVNTLTYHIDNGISGGVPQLCLINGMCHKFISMDNNGNIFASCISHDKQYLISNINEMDTWEPIRTYTDKHIKIKKDSIYYRLGEMEQYKYFQGNGCVKCRTINNNEEFVDGIVKYIRKES